MKTRLRFRRRGRYHILNVPVWLVAAGLIALAAGAAGVGVAFLGNIGGTIGSTVSQSVVIDKGNFEQDDIGGVNDSVITFNDEGTSFTVAAEMFVGDYMVLDVPLANLSDQDAAVIATLKAPGLERDIEVFWSTLTRTDSPSPTTSTPSPAPLTSITSQSSDTVAVTSTPPGIAGLSPQVSNGVPTSSSLGLPDSDPQVVGSTASTSALPGTVAITAQTDDMAISTSAPSLAGLVTMRTIDLAATTTAPTGAVAIAAQDAALASTGVQPSGAPASLSGAWVTGDWEVDWNADGVKETVHLVMSDTAVTGTYDTLDISLDGAFGETAGGPLSNGQVNEYDDERLTASGVDVRIGPYYTFTVAFNSAGTSATLTSMTWYTASVGGTDLDGDGDADDTFHLALSDSDSDGIYEVMDLTIGDQVYGEMGSGSLTDGTVTYHASNNTNDERLTADSDAASDTHEVVLGVNPFGLSWDVSPASSYEVAP